MTVKTNQNALRNALIENSSIRPAANSSQDNNFKHDDKQKSMAAAIAARRASFAVAQKEQKNGA